MTDLDVKQLCSGESNAWFDDLFAVRAPGIGMHKPDGGLCLYTHNLWMYPIYPFSSSISPVSQKHREKHPSLLLHGK